MGEFFKKKIIVKKEEEIPLKEMAEKSEEKKMGKKKEIWREYYQKHKETMKEHQKHYCQWRERISFLKFFEEGKPMTFMELIRKSQIREINIETLKTFKEIGKIRKILTECKKIGLVREVEENVFQINKEAPDFKTFKKFVEREKKRKEVIAK